ncbi:MAG TPA: translation factor GTPase family protein [Micromonosporaceae bacterium]
MRTLNLGILAHVDAGKTSLTERLLYAAGVIESIGSVDDGSTQTDSLALERQRGITIKSAVVSFVIDDVTVNLIDTPGHPDFIAEVERVLSVLDGAVLVVSAVEGVQAQTRVLMRTLRRLRIPTIVFVNKIDRSGAQPARVLRSIAAKLTPAIVPMGTVHDAGTRSVRVAPYDSGLPPGVIEVLAEHDETMLAAYVADEAGVPYERLRRGLAEQAARAQAHPVFFGSAITGAGTDELIAGIVELLPVRTGDVDGTVDGSVFKVERGPAGEKIAYVRMFAGAVRTREMVDFGRAKPARITGIGVFDAGTVARGDTLPAGRIGKVWGLGEVRIGDRIGVRTGSVEQHHFAPPTLETIVSANRRDDSGALHVALTQLAEQDPLIGLRQDPVRQEISVSLYGEVQKEVIQATLADEYGIEVSYRETTTICIERPVGCGTAVETIATGDNPFLATVGLRIEPDPVGSGVTFRLGVEPGSMPPAFFTAVEDTVIETLHQGLYGWQVTDCTVTMTHSGYWARQSSAHGVFDKSMSSTAGDFRNLTPLVLMRALKQATTRVYEPMHRFAVDVPAEVYGVVLPALVRLRGSVRASELRDSSYLLEGVIPAAEVHAFERQLPGLTSGEGIGEYAFDHYQPVRGETRTRARSDHNPLNPKEYLLHVVRRV